MEEGRINEILQTQKDLDMFDEYSKYILVGAVARNGLNNMSGTQFAKTVFDLSLQLVEERKELKKLLKKGGKWNQNNI